MYVARYTKMVYNIYVSKINVFTQNPRYSMVSLEIEYMITETIKQRGG